MHDPPRFLKLNESLQKIVFGHKNSGLRMRKSTLVVIDYSVSLD